MPFLRANTILVLLILSIACTAHAATITFYNLAPTKTGEMPSPTPSYSFRAIGTGADGATTYVKEVVLSESLSLERTVYTSGGTTVTTNTPVATVTGEPITGSAIIVADATHYLYSTHISPLGGDLMEECSVGTATMSCVATLIESSGRSGFTSTGVGPAVPIYTLITSGSRGTKDSANINRILQSLVSGGVVVIGGLFGFFMVI